MPAKGLVADLTHFHAQNVWGSREKRVWVAELASYCNYLKKKKYIYIYIYNANAIETNQLRLAKNKIVRFVPSAG